MSDHDHDYSEVVEVYGNEPENNIRAGEVRKCAVCGYEEFFDDGEAL